jgi:hypothetical protein
MEKTLTKTAVTVAAAVVMLKKVLNTRMLLLRLILPAEIVEKLAL